MNAIGQFALAGMLLALAPNAVRANLETGEQASFAEARPVWRMIWKSPWSILRLPNSSKGVSHSHSRRNRHVNKFRRRRRR